MICSIENLPFFCSWSGGKDSCLAFYYAVQAGGKPCCLFTMLSEEGEHSKSHGLPLRILEQQAASLGVPLVTGASSWEDYERVFIGQLREFKAKGIEVGVFGDIDLEEHRKWQENACAAAEMRAYLPLWGKSRQRVVAELVDLGFQAVIVAVNEEKMDRRYLGRVLNKPLMSELAADGIDVAGENGEFHTIVTDGPLFRFPVDLKINGFKPVGLHCFLDLD
ncbi:MAG: diphthine--ammonia ligase [Thermacetogeniaceae bacterium]|jgi:uncharacterized protein (TIGR00290 family)|nr:diphthine--ammonia ligase [Syntrophomonadaceae bacterium]